MNAQYTYPSRHGETTQTFFTLARLTVRSYRYYDPATRGLYFQGLLEDLSSAPGGAIVLLHACAHNPTGVDPTLEQWEQIRQLVRSRELLPFFDSAYQGFASGSLDGDAKSVRRFAADGGECLIAQSYAKNMGLYGERVGVLSIVCKNVDVASKVEGQLKLVIRPMYSNPPIHGASIVATILKDRGLFNEWAIELKEIADRIISMRHQLFESLRAHLSFLGARIGVATSTPAFTDSSNLFLSDSLVLIVVSIASIWGCHSQQPRCRDLVTVYIGGLMMSR